MDIRYRNSIKIFGAIMLIIGLAMFLPIIIGIIYAEWDCVKAFTATSIPSIFAGIFLISFLKSSDGDMKMRDGFFAVSISWILVSLLGAVPFLLSGVTDSFINAFFESTSGFTTTGASVFDDVEALPHALLFWRTFSHWLGGMGILIFTIAILPMLGIKGQSLASAEMPGPNPAKIFPRIADTARFLYILYLAMTVLEIILLHFGGMNFFDAICHAFSSIGTGGFTNYNDSIGHFGSFYIEAVITVFMVLAGMNFNLFYLFFKNGIKEFFKDSEWRLYMIILLVVSLFMSFTLIINGTYSPINALKLGFFQTASTMTTSGFTASSYMLWPVFCQSLLFMLFFVGGCSSSTSGGIKVVRILIYAKMVKRSLTLRLHPTAIVPIKVGDKHVSGNVISHTSGFLFLYILFGMFTAFLLSFDGFDMTTSISSAFSCLGNIGINISNVTFSEFSGFSKLVMSFAMIAGRLELFTLLVLFTKKFWRPYR